jgi:hypothetical protein
MTPAEPYPVLGHPSSAQSTMAFLRALLLNHLAQCEIVFHQFFSIEFVGKFTLSKAFLFRAIKGFSVRGQPDVTRYENEDSGPIFSLCWLH